MSSHRESWCVLDGQKVRLAKTLMEWGKCFDDWRSRLVDRHYLSPKPTIHPGTAPGPGINTPHYTHRIETVFLGIPGKTFVTTLYALNAKRQVVNTSGEVKAYASTWKGAQRQHDEIIATLSEKFNSHPIEEGKSEGA